MPYYTELQGVSIDLAADPATAAVDPGSQRASFREILGRSIGFDALNGLDPEADPLGQGEAVTLTGDHAATPLEGVVYAGSGTLQSDQVWAGYPEEVAVTIHPIAGHFLVAEGSAGPRVLFVTEEPLDLHTVGYDLSQPPVLELSDVKIADILQTPPLDAPDRVNLRDALLNFVGFRTAVTYDPGGTYALRVAPVPCFTCGTMIETARGLRPVEALQPGELLRTVDHGLQPLRWIGRVVVSAARLRESPALRPVRIRAGALGAGQPAQDLLVSPQHRVLVRSKVAQRMLGATEVLVAARQLLGLPGVTVATELTEVVYYHLLLDRHELLWSNGAATESLYTGMQALKGIGPAARREILTLFPSLREAPPKVVRPLIPGRRARNLAARHLRNRHPLLA